MNESLMYGSEDQGGRAIFFLEFNNLCTRCKQRFWRHTSPPDYQQAMLALGRELGNSLLPKIKTANAKVYLACTAEDADYLAKGILDVLNDRGLNPGMACFWNQRMAPFGIGELQVAPIIRKYQEPIEGQIDLLIIVKSIISGACVVKTNLKHLIQSIETQSIAIVSPVIYSGAKQRLMAEFDSAIYDKFEFFYFAEDDRREANGEVVPGIGGMVYDRLGFDGQDDKNRYFPQIVDDRLEKYSLTA